MAIVKDLAHLEGHIQEVPNHKASSISYGDPINNVSVQDAIDSITIGGVILPRNPATVVVRSLVYFDTTSGQLELAIGNDTYEKQDCWIVKSLPNPTQALVVKQDYITGFGSLTPNINYFLSTNVAGQLQPGPPAIGSGLWAKEVGRALTSDGLLVDLSIVSVFRTP
jgi:hypothetical protein